MVWQLFYFIGEITGIHGSRATEATAKHKTEKMTLNIPI
jgi:hypothetical protein